MTEPSLPRLSLNRDARIEVWRIGEEKQPVFVVDNALLGADELLAYAAALPFGPPADNSLYPGLNAHLPANYIPTLLPALQRPLTQLFGMIKPPQRQFGFFGLTTRPPQAMATRQALPHTDSANLHSFATVHFLNGLFGGTAFYRHKATGCETVTPTRSNLFNAKRSREIEEAGDGADGLLERYYEEIAYAEPMFNRLILYRATQLHSARLENATALSHHPRTGRLTANTFYNT